MAQKMLCCSLILCLVLSVLAVPLPASASRATNRLSLEEAVFHATRNSSGLRDVRVESIKKRAERREAVEAIRIARRRAKYPWFSLLMDINLPQTHGLPKEIELLMTLPEIETELKTLREQEKDEILKVRHDVTAAYLETLQAQYSVERQQLFIRETGEALQRLRRQYMTGRGTREDVEYLEAELEGHRTALQKAVQDLESKQEKLGGMIRIKLNTNTELDDYLPEADLSRQDLELMIEHALKHDFNLFEAVQNRSIAQTEVLQLMDIYAGRWGSKVSSMNNYIRSTLGRQVENLDVRMDYDAFMRNYYEPALDRIEAPWRGSFSFRILFVTIRIPKEWFKQGHLGERYFEDEKYALFKALVEREKAIELENEIRNSLVQQVKDTYFTLKQMESTYEELHNNMECSERNYQSSLRGSRIGLVPFQELHSEKMNYYEQEDSLFEMKLDYGKTIAMFNLYTSGYLDVVRGDFRTTELFDGDSIPLHDRAEPGWYIQTLLSDYKFTFGLNMPEAYNITDYELYTGNHERIGERTEISETISHLPVVFEDSSMLYVKLYREDELIYLAELDGFDIYGTLVLKEAEQQ